MITVDLTGGHVDSANAVMALPAASARAPVQTSLPAIPVGLVQEIAGLCGAVPGLVMVSVTRRVRIQPLVRGGPTTDDIEVAVDGWSPSLHRLSMQWVLPLRGHDPDSPAAADIARDAVCAHVAVQRRRAAHAATIGIAAPLALTARTTMISHLTADRSSLALAALAHGPMTHAVLARAVEKLHLEAVDKDGGHRLDGNGCFVVDELGTQHLGWMTSVANTGSTAVEMINDTVIIHGHVVPETIITALAGRRLDTLAAVHPLLDHRIVAHAEMVGLMDPLISIRLTPDRVRIEGFAPAERSSEPPSS